MIANSSFSKKPLPGTEIIHFQRALFTKWLVFQAYAFVPGKGKDGRRVLARGNPSLVPSAGKSMDDRKLQLFRKVFPGINIVHLERACALY